MQRINTLLLIPITLISLAALVVPWTEKFGAHIADLLGRKLGELL